MSRARLVHVPFVDGQREDIDKKLLPAGFLTRAKNVRMRKDGRWGVRYGDTALELTTNLGTTLVPNDLLSYDERLFAIGDDQGAGDSLPSSDLAEFVSQGQFAWKALATDADATSIKMGLVASVRDIGRPPSSGDNVSRVECAAAGGLVCFVWQAGADSWIQILQASTNTTLFLDFVTGASNPRVVSVGSKFFIGLVSGSLIGLLRYDPATDSSAQVLSTLFGSGDAITHWDFAKNDTDTGAWAVVHRSTPATSIKELDAAGAVTQTFAGPSVAFDFVTIGKTATRVHLAVVRTADSEIDLYSYTTAGVLSPATPTAMFAAATTGKQVGLADTSNTGQASVTLIAETDANPTADVSEESVHPETHAAVASNEWLKTTLGTMPANHAALGRFPFFGGVQLEGSFKGNFLGLVTNRQILTYKDRFVAGVIANDHLPRIALDASTGHRYWPNLVLDQGGLQVPQVTEFDFGGSDRRQTVDMGGLLYLLGGTPQVYDGRQAVEAGYQETPVIHNIAASNGAGALPSSTVLNVAIKWEWEDSLGYRHESSLSEVATVTMGASDDTITFAASTPHSRRCDPDVASNAMVVVYRSLSGKKQLRRAAAIKILTGGATVSVTLTGNDASIAANEIVYTQGGRGALGDTLEHESPLPADFACRFGKRILSAGLPDRFQYQVSKPQFPGEPINWSGDVAFLGTAPDQLRGVASQDGVAYLFSRTKVYAFSGEGPDDTGQGAFSDLVELPSSLGLHTANSIVTTPIGIMYQGDEEKLMLIPRGGGAPEWFGQPVRDTLKAFPVVTAAAVMPTEQLVTFACSNTGGTDGRLIHYDLRSKAWLVDEFDGSTPITSITEYQGRLARLSEGVITLANETHPAATFIEHSLTTGTLRPFGDNAWGKLINITFLGEFRGNCTVTCLISYDDGKTWTTLPSFHLSTADRVVGDVVRLQWWPRRRKGDRFMLEFRVTALAGAASEGVCFNEYTLGVMGKNGETRLSAGKRK